LLKLICQKEDFFLGVFISCATTLREFYLSQYFCYGEYNCLWGSHFSEVYSCV